jgi:hypothetical protein
MANHSVKSVHTSPVLLSPRATHSNIDLVIQNNSEADLFLGSSDVSLQDYGFKLSSNTAISLMLSGRDEIYGITSNSEAIDINTLSVEIA